jgi:hypothetical protein
LSQHAHLSQRTSRHIAFVAARSLVISIRLTDTTAGRTTCMMLSLLLLLLGALFIVIAIATLALDGKQRNVVLQRFDVQRRRATGSLTPPRSLTPEKQGLPSNKPSLEPDFSNAFPPSRREALADLLLDPTKGPGESATQLSQMPPDYAKRLPSEEVWDADRFADHVTATGFTLEEIKRLGDFPDYATLSGVPLPREYEGFEISTAKARPYRPLRWAYHQTMCTEYLIFLCCYRTG